MSFARGTWCLFLTGLVALQPVLLIAGCATYTPDKRVLQYLNTQGFGKRYFGNAQEENYVSLGDTVSFVDTYNPDLRGQELVDIDGTIQIPEVGSVFVAGMTRSELEAYLTQKLSPYYVETDVKVIINTRQSQVYFVVGEVAVPGAFPFRGDMTVFEAVLAAQPNEFTANLSRVELIRADPRDPLIIPVDINDMWKSGDSTTAGVNVQEFDIIYVPPTLLQQLADFVSSLIVPLTSVLREIWVVIFQFGRGFFGYGGGFYGGQQNRSF